VCAKWVPQSLTVQRKAYRKTISFEFFAQSQVQGETLSRIVKADETMVHHFEPETKRQCNDTIPNLPGRRNSQSADKVMIILFWDCEGVILVDVTGEAIKSNA